MSLQRRVIISKWLIVPALVTPLIALTACSASWTNSFTYPSNGHWSFTTSITIKPPASYLANFDASQAVQNYVFQNSSVYSKTGSLAVTVSDQVTGAVLGTNSFGYTINSGNQLVLDDPASATAWIRSFSDYGGYVTVAVNVPVEATAPPSGQNATATATGVYEGQAEGSTSVTMTTIGGSGGCGASRTMFCKT